MKSIFSSPFVSSQRPNTELAAAKTEHRELSVVVIPACNLYIVTEQGQIYRLMTVSYTHLLSVLLFMCITRVLLNYIV